MQIDPLNFFTSCNCTKNATKTGATPDPLHTYMSLCGFALAQSVLVGREGDESCGWIKPVCPSLGFSMHAASLFAP